MLIASSLYHGCHMFTKLPLMYCICNHKERACVCSATRSGQCHSLWVGGVCESIMKSVLLLMMIKMMVVARSIHVMYYLMHRTFYGPHMSSSKDK